MEALVQILVLSVDSLFDIVPMFFALVTDVIKLLPDADPTVLLFAAAPITYSNIPAEVLATSRRWHGTIDEQFGNIDNVVVTIQGHSAWGTPPVFSQIVTNRTQLMTLITKCRSPQGSAADRGLRNLLLKTTVGLCVGQVKIWAFLQYFNNVMTLNDVHTLGFLLPGESGGRHGRAEATNVLAEVKITIINADMIRVIIDQASDDNAALTVHGWPPGVRQAVIVITASDGVTEVIRHYTTRLHNDIRMPSGSHGKQFLAKASFLRHIDDDLRFGPQPTFSMPLTTEDLVSTLDRQHHEEFEAHLRDVELHRQEIEKLKTAATPSNQPPKE
jgi:hypothetical protein